METRKTVGLVIALSASALLSTGDAALAQTTKKVSYEQAWKLCKQALAKESHAALDTNTRYLRGGACMAKYGYKF